MSDCLHQPKRELEAGGAGGWILLECTRPDAGSRALCASSSFRWDFTQPDWHDPVARSAKTVLPSKEAAARKFSFDCVCTRETHHVEQLFRMDRSNVDARCRPEIPFTRRSHKTHQVFRGPDASSEKWNQKFRLIKPTDGVELV